MRDLETTAQIRREDLTDLLELEKAPAKQRVTAEMPAVTLTNLLAIDDSVAMPTLAGTKRVRARATARPDAALELPVVTFRNSAPQPLAEWPLNRWPTPFVRAARSLRRIPRPVVIAFSASATLMIARLVTML